jgi:hypothetical protein
VFYLLALMAVASLISVMAIPESAIDHNLARGLHDADADAGSLSETDQPSGLRILLTCRPLLIFAVCVTLFHLSNAAMLPLVGQKLALQDKNLGTSLMSACIVAAQIVMVPMAMLVGAKADAWGHKRFFLAALLILPLRGALYTLSDNKAWLVGVQLLDGIGAGIFRRGLSRNRGRPDAQHRPLQCRPRRGDHGAEHRRGAIDDAGGTGGGQGRLQRRLPHARRGGGGRRRVLVRAARNRRALRSRRDKEADSAAGFRYRCRIANRVDLWRPT